MELWKPRFHGNGFIQVYLDRETRLHIWSPDFLPTRVENAQIHDHRFFFESTVLMGSLTNIDYEVHFPGEGHGLWCQGKGRSDKSSPLEYLGSCGVRPEIEATQYRAGASYSHGGPRRFHATGPTDPGHLTVTIMRKTSVEPGYRARIVSWDNEKPDHAFLNQPPQHLLNEEFRRVLKMLSLGL